MKTNHNNSPISVQLKDLFSEVKLVTSIIFSSRANLLHALLLTILSVIVIDIGGAIILNILMATWVGVTFLFWVDFANDLKLGNDPSFKKTFARIADSFMPLAVFGIIYLIGTIVVFCVGLFALFLVMSGITYFIDGGQIDWTHLVVSIGAIYLFLTYGGWLLFAVPAAFGHSLIALQGVPALEALKHSVIGSLKNIKLLILVSAATPIIIFTSHISFGLSHIVTIPIYFIFIYTAYCQIWPTSSGHSDEISNQDTK